MDAHSCLTFLRWSEDELPLLVSVCLIITHMSAVEQPQQNEQQKKQKKQSKEH